MPAGYGTDTANSGTDIAAALAQIFQTGVTAYTDSQAIQNGYQINDPRYFQSGYPAGVSSVYTPTTAGAGVVLGKSNGSALLLVGLGVLALVLLLKR